MPRVLAFIAAVSALSLLAPAALHAQARSTLVPNRLTQPINDNARVTLKGTVHPFANALNDRGAASASMPLDRIQIVLKRSAAQETALQQLIEDQNRPGSESYHKWLTPAEFGQEFGPSDQDVATLEAWLQSQGFNIGKLNPGRQTLEVSGSAAQFQNAFHAQIHQYAVDGQIHYANATNPQIPAALAPVFGGFASLNNFHLKSKARMRGKALYNPKTGTATPQWTVGSAGQDSFVLSPADFAVQYDLNPLYTAGTTGAGQTIAIINGANINIGLVNAFRSTFNLPVNPPQVVIDGNDPGVDGVNNPDGPNGYSIEAYVDVEWAGAVAPGAKVDLVIASDTALESGLILAAEHAIYGNIAPVISFSFGYCESGLTSENAFINNLWEQAAAQGITVMVASGDSASAACDSSNAEYATQGAAVSGFASTPYNVAVGGTDFYYSSYNQGASAISSQLATYWNTTPSNGAATVSIKRYIPEQPWNDSQFGLNLLSYYTSLGSTTIAGAGGGPSTCGKPTLDSSGNVTTCAPYPKPSWQTGVGVPADNARDIPDVSLFAADAVNESYYPSCAEDGDCQGAGSSGVIQISGGGGTSFASPAFAGIMALVNQKYGRQGQADYVFYPLAAQFPAAFHDVANGNNSVPCTYSASSSANSKDCIAVTSPITIGSVTEGQIGVNGMPAYKAGAGYDLASGLGSVDAALLVNNWDKVTFASSAVTFTPSSTSFTHGTAISISGTVTGSSPTGSVALMTDSGEQSQQAQGIGQFLNGASSLFPVSGGAFSGSNITTLPGGTYNIWGQYSGDATNAPSTSQKTSITVNPEASGIILNILSPSGSSYVTASGSIAYGTQLQFNAVVAPSSKLTAEQNCLTGSATTCPVYGPATGTVVFSDGGAPFNTATLNAEGDAEYNSADPVAAKSVTNVGSHSITASYSGDNSYQSSAAAALTYTVVKSMPQMNVYVSPNTPQAGQPTVFTIVVQSVGVGAPPSGTVSISGAPSGTPTSVTLSPGASPAGQVSATANSAGIALVTIPTSAAAGPYNITFTYGGDSNYTAPPPVTGTLTIAAKSTLKPTTTTLSTSASATSPTAQLSITMTVTGDGSTVPTGSVQLQSSSYILGTFTLTPIPGTKNAGITVAGNSAEFLQGANLLTAIYSGDTVYAGSSATAAVTNPLADFTMTPATTRIDLRSTSSTTDVIQLASVNGFAGALKLGCTASSGIICSLSSTAPTLTSGSNTAVTLTVDASNMTTAGTYNLLLTGTDSSGKYVHTLGLQVVAPVSSVAAGFSVTPAPSSVTVAPGNSATDTLTVSPTGGFTGTVAISCVVTGAGANPPTCSAPSANVTLATAATSTLTIATAANTDVGSYTANITATSGAITATATVGIAVSTTPVGFSLSPSPASLTLAAGATTGNTSTITVTPASGFTGVVNFTCAVTTAPASANDSPACSAPAATVSGTTAATSTLTITTTASTTSAAHNPLNKFFTAGGGVVIAGLLFFGIPARRRKWRSILVILLFAGIAGFGIGCGSGSGSSGSGGGGGGGGGGGTTLPGTTAGNYVLTVTGKDAATGNITASTTVNLTVN
ncbi:MAG: protease pro-enzyme activation domain-containing protein [Acidobacteriaceae bacterium]